MGWGDWGQDSKGRPIGYLFVAKCDHPKCGKEIDRGIGYACGGMHGENGYDCEGYFCYDHLLLGVETPDGECSHFCHACEKLIEKEKEENGSD